MQPDLMLNGWTILLVPYLIIHLIFAMDVVEHCWDRGFHWFTVVVAIILGPLAMIPYLIGRYRQR